MTASITAQHHSRAVPTTRARAHGIDLLVMRLSIAALRWARRRADRSLSTREGFALTHHRDEATRRREHGYAVRTEAPRY